MRAYECSNCGKRGSTSRDDTAELHSVDRIFDCTLFTGASLVLDLSQRRHDSSPSSPTPSSTVNRHCVPPNHLALRSDFASDRLAMTSAPDSSVAAPSAPQHSSAPPSSTPDAATVSTPSPAPVQQTEDEDTMQKKSNYYFFKSTAPEEAAKYKPQKIDCQQLAQLAIDSQQNKPAGSAWNTAGTCESV